MFYLFTGTPSICDVALIRPSVRTGAPSPSGKALITLYNSFHDMLTKMSCRSLSIFNLYVLTFLFYCDKNFLYNNLITLYNERSVPHETHPSL